MDKWIPPALLAYIVIAILFPWILLITAFVLLVWLFFLYYFYTTAPTPYLSVDNKGIRVNWFTAGRFLKTELVYQIEDKSEPAKTLFPSDFIHNEATGPFYLYSEKITDFVPGAKYSYKIVETKDNGKRRTLFGGNDYYFIGPYLGDGWDSNCIKNKFRVGVFGDMQPRTLNPPLFQWQIIRALKKYNPDLILYLGDHTMFGINAFQWRWLYHILGPISKNTPILGVVGNHDLKTAPEDKDKPEKRGYFYRTYVNYPENKAYYSVTINNIQVLAFDFGQPIEAGSPEYNYMVEKIQENTPNQELVCMWHVSPYTTMLPSEKVQNMRDLIIPKIEQKGGRLWFGGHEHAYQHFLVNDIHYITSAATSSFHKHWQTEDYMEKLVMKMHFVIADFCFDDEYKGDIQIRAISKRNQLIDQFTIEKK